jgi:FkbM family methyltransferase
VLRQTYVRILDSIVGRPERGAAVRRKLLEGAIRLAARAAVRATGWQFPPRSTGGWWWTSRYRFEVAVGWWDWSTVKWCRRLIRPGMHVLDVGAHIGYYTRLFGRLVGQSGRVVAYEPFVENFSVLKHNTSDRVPCLLDLFNLAVARSASKVDLYVSPGHSNHSLYSSFIGSNESVGVQSVSLDTHLQSIGFAGVDLIKIDIEGAEVEALEGATDTLRDQAQTAMIVELNPPALRAAGSSASDLVSVVRSYGYDPYVIQDYPRLGWPAPESSQAVQDLLCLSRAHWKELGVRLPSPLP